MRARATLVIDGMLYSLRGHKGTAWLLTKDGETVPYTIQRTHDGWWCTCPASSHNRNKDCKHVLSLYAVGFIWDE